MNKKQFDEWNKLYEYVRIEIMGYSEEELSRNMVVSLKYLFLYMNRITEVFTYLDLLRMFKQCKNDINLIFNDKKYENDYDKFREICSYIKSYFIEIWDESDEKIVEEYYSKPIDVFYKTYSARIKTEIDDMFHSRMAELKKENNQENNRSFTMTGAIHTCIAAIAKGLLDFRESEDGKIYMVAKEGVVEGISECRLWEKD